MWLDIRLGLVLLLGVTACSDRSFSEADAIHAYYAGLNASDFGQVDHIVADTFTRIEGEFVMPYTRDEHYVVFQWDSVFATTYDVKDVEVIEGGARALVSSQSIRYAFLENDPLTCQMIFGFNEGKIAQLEAGECAEADWALWASKRDSLIAWTERNHVELSGFINDMTKEGAEKYVKAIELYEAESGLMPEGPYRRQSAGE